MVALWNTFAPLWYEWMAAMLWQSTLLIGAVFLIDTLLRRSGWPQLRWGLWLVVSIKLIVPPTLSSPYGLSSFWDLHKPGLEVLSESVALEAEALPDGRIGPNGFSRKIGFWLIPIWLSGVFLGVAGTWLRSRRFRARLDAEAAGIPGWLQREAERAAGTLGLRSSPRLLVSRHLRSPAVVGVLRPVVIIPADLLEVGRSRALCHVLLHEFAHIKRGDLWVEAFTRLIHMLYWFFPLMFLIRSRLRTLCELCCDARVARLGPGGAGEYRRTLLVCAGRLLDPAGNVSWSQLALTGQSSDILTRLRSLERLPSESKWRAPAVFSIVLALLFVAVPMAPPTEEAVGEQPAEDRYADLAWENLRKAARGDRPGGTRLKYSALYLTLLEQKTAESEKRDR